MIGYAIIYINIKKIEKKDEIETHIKSLINQTKYNT